MKWQTGSGNIPEIDGREFSDLCEYFITINEVAMWLDLDI